MAFLDEVRQIPKPKKMEGGIKSHTDLINDIGDGLVKVIEAAEKNVGDDGGGAGLPQNTEVVWLNDNGEARQYRIVAEPIE